MSTPSGHCIDEMTPRQRLQAYANGQAIDRIPCLPLVGGHAARLIGCRVRDYLLDYKLMAEAQLAAYRLYRHDSLAVAPGSHVLAVALGGGDIIYPDEGVAAMGENPLTDEAGLERLHIPDAAVDGDLPVYLHALQTLLADVGDEVGVGLILGGPLTTAASTYGTDRLLRSMIKHPEFTHKLLEFVLAAAVSVARQFIREGAQIIIVDPVASGSVLGVAQAREFAFAYSARMIAELRPLCPGIILHICGNTTKLLESMAATGAACLSLDNIVDLEFAKRAVGGQVTLAGNVNPVDTMFHGTPETVKQEAKACLRKAFDSPRGYLLSTGCDLPIDTPPENIQALMEAARTYGRWPIDPARLS